MLDFLHYAVDSVQEVLVSVWKYRDLWMLFEGLLTAEKNTKYVVI